jgi:hypothetical protein
MSTPSGHGPRPSQARYHVTFSAVFAICRAFLRVLANRRLPAHHPGVPARLVPTRQRCAVRGISPDVKGATTLASRAVGEVEEISVQEDIVLVGDRKIAMQMTNASLYGD